MSFRDEFVAALRTRDDALNRAHNLSYQVTADIKTLTTESEKRQYIAVLDREFCRRSAYYFMVNFWSTFDPKARQRGNLEDSIRMPRSRLLWLLCWMFQNLPHGTVWNILKSRQKPMFSHTMAGLYTWKCMTQPMRYVIFHSTGIDKSGYGGSAYNPETLLGRVKWGYSHLPPHILALNPVHADFDMAKDRPKAVFYHRPSGTSAEFIPSIIEAHPDTMPNTLSPSDAFNDEVGHQRDPYMFYRAIIPTGATVVSVGTPDSEKHPEGIQWFLDNIEPQGSEDEPEPEEEELMPYSDSFSGSFLKSIMADGTDYEIGFRFLARRLNNGNITSRIHFRSAVGGGKTYRATEVNKIISKRQRAEEHDCELHSRDSKTRLWRLPDDGSGLRHFEYDPSQTGEFHLITRPWDFGNYSGVLFIQKVKMGPTPNSYQMRILGEVVTDGPLVHEVAEEVHQRMEQWFPAYGKGTSCRDYPDVAGKQGNRQTGKTDEKVITERMQKYEPGFSAPYMRRIGVKEGIVEVALKLNEILGYDEKGEPIRGLVVSPTRAPLTVRALQGELKQKDDGSIKKPNHPWEEVGDCLRYVGANDIDRADIVQVGSVLPGQAAQLAELTDEERKQKVNEWTMRELEGEMIRRRELAMVEVTSDSYYEEE
jgi:hypothetical protein